MVQQPPETGSLLLDPADGDADLAVVDTAAPAGRVGHLLELLVRIEDHGDLLVRVIGQCPADLTVGIFADPQDDPARLDLFPSLVLDGKMARDFPI